MQLLHKHLRAHKIVLNLIHSYLHFIDFIHVFYIKIINFVYNKFR